MKKFIPILVLLVCCNACVCPITIIDKTRFYAHGYYKINGVQLGATDQEAYENITMILSDVKKCGCTEICVGDMSYVFYQKGKMICVDILDDDYEDDDYDYKKELKMLKGMLW